MASRKIQSTVSIIAIIVYQQTCTYSKPSIQSNHVLFISCRLSPAPLAQSPPTTPLSHDSPTTPPTPDSPTTPLTPDSPTTPLSHHASPPFPENDARSSSDTFDSNIDGSFLQPLYSGASVTVCGAYFSIMQYATANKLTYTAIEELLKLLQILCPSPNSLPTTLYKFKKFFQQYSAGFEQQQVCSECFTSLNKGEVCATCVDADNPVHSPVRPGLLVQIPFHKPLQAVLSSESDSLSPPLFSVM